MTARSGPAGTVVLAEHAITMGAGQVPGPVAVAIDDGLIRHVLPRAQAGSVIDSGTEVIDAGARTIMPGFVDPHAHAEVAARARYETVDCRAPGCAGISDVLDTLRDALPRARDGWLVAQANLFFDQKLADRRFPTREELDSVSRSVAIVVRAGGHLSILNTAALERAGIDGDYRAVDYSITGKPGVGRDAAGNATGIVTEMDKLLPLPELSTDELREAVVAGTAELFTQHGVTTLGEISQSLEGLRFYDEAIACGALPLRMHVYLWAPGTVTVAEACDVRSWSQGVSDPSMFRFHGVKLFADGGYSAAKAALSRPYALDGCGCGDLALSTEELTDALVRTRDAGLQLAVHANGDRAQREVCAAIAQVGPSTGAPRARVEHAGNFMPDYDELTEAWQAAGIIPVPQPVFIHNFAEFLPSYVGEYARDRQFPFRRLLDDGWRLTGSSDVWVGSEQRQTNPFHGIASCVNRRSFHGHVICPGQEVSVAEALRMHTLDAAAALEAESTRGSLEAGKYADIVVLDRNPLRIAQDELSEVRVDEVILAGRSVHTRE